VPSDTSAAAMSWVVDMVTSRSARP
jgi:hypothetical protein